MSRRPVKGSLWEVSRGSRYGHLGAGGFKFTPGALDRGREKRELSSELRRGGKRANSAIRKFSWETED